MSQISQTPPPLLSRLVQDHAAQWVDTASLAAWADQPGHAVLLIAGDAVRFPEGLDVAVVLPELRRAAGAGQHFRIGVAISADEDELGKRYGAQRRPCLIFLRDGHYVTTVAGMHDWNEFVQMVLQALAMPTSRAPIGIAIEGGSAQPSACH
jgi:hydrogenase-1 operon protein HyaE